MTFFTDLSGRARDDRGGVMVMVAVALGTLLMFVVLVLEVGNWFEHRRHLQLQVDAGTLAGAGLFGRCFGDSTAGSAAMETEARRYSGAYPGAFNEQIGGDHRGDITILINSRTFAVGSQTDGTVREGPPCSVGMLDLKGTEAGLPSFFGALGSIVPAINARARAQLLLVTTRAGNLPLAVPDNNVEAAEVRFVDEDTGEQLGSAELEQVGVVDGLVMWTTPAPAAVQVGAGNRNIGMRVVLSGDENLDCESLLAECVDASRDSGGIVYLRGWSAAGDGEPPNPPVARRVSLFPVPVCTSSAFFSDRRPCDAVGVRAVVDIGARDPQDVLIWAEGGNCVQGGQSRCHLEFQSGEWATTGQASGNPQKRHVAIPAGTDDRFAITLHWEITSGTVGAATCNTSNNNPCKGAFEGGSAIQRTFGGAIDLSGPIKFAEVQDAATGFTLDHVQRPETGTAAHSLNAAIGIIPAFANAQGPDAPEVALRVMRESDEGEDQSTSRNRSIRCDPGWPNLRTELENGCRPQYTVNTGIPCEGPFGHEQLWNQPEPWPCVKVATGGAVGQVSQGMTARILQGGTCDDHPNNWGLYPDLPPGDTRIVSVILTRFGALSGQGQGTVPVSGFASFYVTAWPEGGNNRRQRAYCPADRTVDGVFRPVPKGYILGRFINNVDDFNSGGGTEPCPFLDPEFVGIGSCVAVLTD